jgi:hypothetical protein
MTLWCHDNWFVGLQECDVVLERSPRCLVPGQGEARKARRFLETATAFGRYPGLVYDLLLCAIDNEIQHRGQAYVYLRSLGIEPPPFYECE